VRAKGTGCYHVVSRTVDRVFRLDDGEKAVFQKIMHDRGIGIGVHYPSIPSLKYYRDFGYVDEDTPVAARVRARDSMTTPSPTMEACTSTTSRDRG